MRRTATTLAVFFALAASAAAQPPVQVTAPLDGARVPASAFGKKLVTANVTLSGRAPAGTNVPISATCRGFDCTAITFAGRDGRWSTRLQLMARKGHQRVTVNVAGVPLRLTLSKRVPPVFSAPLALPGGLGGGDSVVVIGDSLAVGMAFDLQALLPGRPVLVDARVGRALDEGMSVLAGADPPRASFLFSLFTNDDPIRIEALDAAVRASVASLGPHGCAVWATIVRPKVGGRTYGAVNARLRALALDPSLSGRLLVADWARAVRGHRKQWLAKDGVHGTAAGYWARAQLYADALARCVS
ncbi:MAG TPA: hypothetical protein VFL73_01210 [Solirubrobacteraceae bacterium]|nr:hypothetical protein [Solirubrobacteraceae bacterium]